MRDGEARRVQEEFTRAASVFAERTQGRFDELDVVAFSRVQPHGSVLEVGVGTGNFLSLFEGHAARLIGVDLTFAMLVQAAARASGIEVVQGAADKLPFRSRSVDLVTSAQTLHHIHEPLPVLMEMRRISTGAGRVLIVDQVAPERYEQMAFMNELEALRDPSHASSRPPSTLRMLLAAAGLEIEDERLVEERSSLSRWMWPEEFPQERIDAVRRFIESFGHETGMGFEREGDDWSFSRRRIMLLARRAQLGPGSG